MVYIYIYITIYPTVNHHLSGNPPVNIPPRHRISTRLQRFQHPRLVHLLNAPQQLGVQVLIAMAGALPGERGARGEAMATERW